MTDKVVKLVGKGKKVMLDVLERLKLLDLLPREGTFLNLKLLRLAKEDLSFTEEENRTLQFRPEQQGDQMMMVWNTIALTNKETGETVKAPDAILKQMAAKDPEAFDWQPACPPKEFVFGEVIEGIIVEKLQALNDAVPPKLTDDLFTLYEKFVFKGDDEPGEETRH